MSSNNYIILLTNQINQRRRNKSFLVKSHGLELQKASKTQQTIYTFVHPYNSHMFVDFLYNFVIPTTKKMGWSLK